MTKQNQRILFPGNKLHNSVLNFFCCLVFKLNAFIKHINHLGFLRFCMPSNQIFHEPASISFKNVKRKR